MVRYFLNRKRVRVFAEIPIKKEQIVFTKIDEDNNDFIWFYYLDKVPKE